MAEDLERGEIVVHQGQGVLFAGEVVDRDVASSVELLEGVEEVQPVIRPAPEPLRGGGGVKRLRLHVKNTRRRLEPGFVEAVFEGRGTQVEIPRPR